TPNANYNGSDSFEVTVADGKGGTTTITIPVTIAAVNDAPTATVSSISTDEDKPVTGNVVGQDVDGDSLSYTVSTN
ncbi:Ig-like domain-containing protein, partial [Acinetobacter ursingii]